MDKHEEDTAVTTPGSASKEEVTEPGPVPSSTEDLHARLEALEAELAAEREQHLRAVAELERRGWLKRRPYPQDRRVEQLTLTAAGRKVFGDNKVAVEALGEMEERMASRKVKIDDSLKYRVGPVLTFDPTKEQFTGPGADKANKLVSRDYRKPFVVPDKVV